VDRLGLRQTVGDRSGRGPEDTRRGNSNNTDSSMLVLQCLDLVGRVLQLGFYTD